MGDSNDSDRQKEVKASARVKWLYVMFVFLVLLALALVQYTILSKDIAEVKNEVLSITNELDWRWRQRVQANELSDWRIQLEVGTIQFLGNGFSVSLDKVQFGSEGVYLSGELGNPTNLTASSLILTFSVYEPLYKRKEEYLALDWDERLFFFANQVSRVQSSPIPNLPPGQTASFEVTIPNIAQDQKNELNFRLSFSGVRYSY